ncbi:MAG: transcriptional repressor NrdR [Candidatus Moranbacteria bacterium]|nr:transcriptional repressor NrdR [Candidatus Moranbacteria bacterium]
MKCPFCKNQETMVIDSRETLDRKAIRRRRKCVKCSARFTTYERPELTEIKVIKRNGEKEVYQRGKIEKGLEIALEKRPINPKKVIEIVDNVESRIFAGNKEEINSRQIGKFITESLKKVDEVAYLRFLSVYRSFGSLESFDKEIKKLKNND